MSKTKEEIVQQWRDALQEAARTAVEALSADIPIDKPTSPLDERIHKLGQAILRIRELVRPEPKSVAFLEEEAWYRMNGAAKPAGVFHTPKEIIDFVTANPSLGEVKDAPTPIDPNAPKIRRGEGHAWADVKTDTCGIRRGNGTVRAWAIRENAGVEVFAKQLFADGKPQSSWTFTGTVDCEKMIFGIIIGGRNKANQIVRFIRNGLLSSRLRLKHKRMNRKAREDANAGEKEGC